LNFEFTDLGILFEFDMISTLALGLISLFIGVWIKKKIPWLERMGFPAPVIGGILFAIVHLLIRTSEIGAIEYNTTLQTPFMVAFFTVIGLGSSIAGLKKGGKLLVIFWVLSGIMTAMQTIIGVTVAKLTDIHPLFGVLGGSVSMSGGHGSAGAFGSSIEEMGLTGASTMALSSATFGLLAGGLIGAPLAIWLIKKYKLKPREADLITKEEAVNKGEKKSIEEVTPDKLLLHIAMLATIMGVGMAFSSVLKAQYAIALPSYVGAMFVAIVFNNLNNKFEWIKIDRSLVDIIGITSLNIFLSMALISLKLWELADLAVPMLTILAAQVVFMILYVRYVVFKAMGGDYDAAVMVAGITGSGLGATTNAMLNMGEVSNRYGYTVNPYLIIPLVGAFLIDMVQMPVIIYAINLFKSIPM